MLCAFQASAHRSYSLLPADEEAGGQTCLALPINLLILISLQQTGSPLMETPILQNHLCFKQPGPRYHTSTSLLNVDTAVCLHVLTKCPSWFRPSLHSWAHFLVLLQCWDTPRLTQSKQRNSVFSLDKCASLTILLPTCRQPLPFMCSSNTNVHFDFMPACSPTSLTACS